LPKQLAEIIIEDKEFEKQQDKEINEKLIKLGLASFNLNRFKKTDLDSKSLHRALNCNKTVFLFYLNN
jgi:hypothetical protein